MNVVRSRVALLSLLTALVSCWHSAAAQTAAPGAAAGVRLSTEVVVGALQGAGFQAQTLKSESNGASQILTGIGGFKVLLGTYVCQPAAQVCAVTLMSVFQDVTDVSDEALVSLNATAFPKVGRQTGKDGKTGGLTVSYVFPCEGFTDPSFIPMILRNFGPGLQDVVTASRKMGLVRSPSGSPPVPDVAATVGQEMRLWQDKPQYSVLAGAPHAQSSHLKSGAAPEYPKELRAHPVEATVKVSFVVDARGKVEDARVLTSTDARFNEAALAAIRKSTFTPAQGSSGPEKEMSTQEFTFKMP